MKNGWLATPRGAGTAGLAFLALTLHVAPASAKTACVPSPTLSTGPPGILLVGQNGTPDPLGSATFVVRDPVGNVVPNSVVMLNSSNCPDVKFAADSGPNVWVNCAASTVAAVTAADGSVTIQIVGSGAASPPRMIGNCLGVSVDGVPLAPRAIAALDLDGQNGINPSDLSLAYGDVVSGQYRPRCDYDFDGDLDPVDLCILARGVFAGASSFSGTACP